MADNRPSSAKRDSNPFCSGSSALYQSDIVDRLDSAVQAQAEAAIKDIDSEIVALNHHPLFAYLSQRSQEGFTPQQFCAFGRGYLEACKQVVPLFELAATRAEEQGDTRTLQVMRDNLEEEYGGQAGGGARHANRVHMLTAQRSYHLHAKQVFGVDADDFDATPVTPAVARYIQSQRAVYDDVSYHAMIGACYVDEKGSVGMMDSYFSYFFQSYREKYASTQAFNEVATYWREHTDGLEAQHAQNIRDALLTNCKTGDDVTAMERGCKTLLAAQKQLLDGVLLEMERAERIGVAIPTGAQGSMGAWV